MLVVSYTTVSPLPAHEALAVCFLLHVPAGHPGWALPTTLLCGARTFLGERCRSTLDAAARPTHSLFQSTRRRSGRHYLCPSAARRAAPTMPAVLRSFAGTMGALTSMYPTNLSKFFETPPPTTKRSGEKSISTVE